MKTTALAIIPRTIGEATELAERLSKSALLPKAMQGKMPDVLVTILAGQEMGLSPMASLRNFHVIEGKPVLSADGMVALVLGSGKAAYFDRVEETETSVTYETLRVGSQKPRRCTWTLAMAKAAALQVKDNWRLYPRAMLAARAKAELARDVYPDVIAGCYTEDEAQDWTADAIDAEIVSETPVAEPPELAQIDTFETEADLKAFASTLKEKIPEKFKAVANAKYSARLAHLRSRVATEPAA
jgi:hypothetical protein